MQALVFPALPAGETTPVTAIQAEEFPSDLPLATVAWRSWLSIKPAVMAWLWYLNALYWVGLFYLPRAEALWVVLAYFAVGPLVVVMVRSQRGLTRLAGLIHLPWVPLIVYLGLRLYTDLLGPALLAADDPWYYYWLQVVFFSTVICVVLDVVDVVRWLAGERYVLGTPAAAARGASGLAAQEL